MHFLQECWHIFSKNIDLNDILHFNNTVSLLNQKCFLFANLSYFDHQYHHYNTARMHAGQYSTVLN